jgi:hypothetical protein
MSDGGLKIQPAQAKKKFMYDYFKTIPYLLRSVLVKNAYLCEFTEVQLLCLRQDISTTGIQRQA